MARLLKDWLDSFLEYTENSEPPRSFRLWTGISVVAAVLQRKCHLPFGGNDAYPNLYIVLVGPPGSRKGTAMGYGYDLLNDLGIKLAAEATTREALIRSLRRSTTSSLDANGNLLMHSSLTVFSQELTVFLGYSNIQLMTDLCDWYDCRKRWTYDTKNMGTDEILGVWVNIEGATTPDLLQTTMPKDAVGAGLGSRIIFVYEPRKAKVVHYENLKQTKRELDLARELLVDLEQIYMMAGSFQTTQPFLDLMHEWREEHEAHPPFDDARLIYYNERRPMTVLKLSMIMNASRSEHMILDEEDLVKAVKILEMAEKKMPKAFSGVGKTRLVDVLTKIWSYIAYTKKVKLSLLAERFHYDADKRELAGIIETLKMMKIITFVYEGDDPLIIYKGTKEQEEKHGI